MTKLCEFNYKNVIAIKGGLSKKQIAEAIKEYKNIIPDVCEKFQSSEFEFARLPFDTKIPDKIENFFSQSQRRFKNFVQVGIGGSILGAIALFKALASPHHNLLKNTTRIYFLDNIDPVKTASLLESIDFKQTLFHIVSKSGQTIETISQFFIILDKLKKCRGNRLAEHLVFTTDPKSGYLRDFARKHKIYTFDFPVNVAGRYSVFSSVGLLSSKFAGIDIQKVLQGARSMAKICFTKSAYKNTAFIMALICHLLYTKKSKDILVLMPYCEQLSAIADWFLQLWAESLGKRFTKNGKEMFLGSTPVKAIGTIDQHSQLQLYNEGPDNKFIIFIEPKKFNYDMVVKTDKDDFVYLNKKDLSEIMIAEKQATETSLCANNRPNASIILPEISPETIGGLLFLFQMQTVFASYFLNVDPFNQPGVELGKKLTIKYLQK